MSSMFYELPVFVSLLLIIVIAVALAGIGRLIAFKYMKKEQHNLNNLALLVWAFIWFPLIALIANNLHDIQRMNDLSIEEANQAKVFFYDIQLINDSKTRERLKIATIEYINNMAEKEQQYLALGSECVECSQAFNNMSQAIYDFLPGEANSQQWANNRIMESILKLDNLRKLRLAHLANFDSTFSVSLILLLFIVAILLSGMYASDLRFIKNFVCGLMILLFSGGLWFYLQLDRPFNSVFSIDNSQFKTIRQEIQRGFFFSHDLDGNPTKSSLAPQQNPNYD